MRRTPVCTAVLLSVALGVLTPALVQAQETTETPMILEEIIVTATREEESIQDVPVAVTANTGDELQLKTVYDGSAVATLSPSINYAKTNNSFAGPTLVIRGIGTVGTARAFEGSVGVFIDGVYRSRPGHILNTFLDVERLQVSRGPQGTLFGKNTTAGALILESNKPVVSDGVTGNYNFSVGEHSAYRAQATVNVPITDRSAFRIAASTDDRDGYFDELFTGETESGGGTDALRLSYMFQPSEDVEVVLTADYSEREAICCYGVGNITDDPLAGIFSAFSAARGAQFPNPGGTFGRQIYLNHLAEDNTIDQGVNLNIEADNVLGGSITAIISTRKWEAENIGFDGEYLPVDILVGDFENFESDSISAELLYKVSPNDRLNLLTGLYYSQEDIAIDRQFSNGADAQAFWNTFIPIALAGTGLDSVLALTPNPGGFAPAGALISSETMRGDNESLGAFFRAEYEFTDQLSGFAGVRWSRDEKQGSYTDARNPQNQAAALGFFGGLAIGDIPTAIAAGSVLDPFVILGVLPSLEYDDTFEDDEVSYALGLQYQLSESASLYASFNRGFKAGGVSFDQASRGGLSEFLGAAPERDPTYDSEIVENFELGAKVSWLGGAARTNIALFYNDIDNLQLNQFTGLNFIVVNGGTAETAGIEIEHTQQVSDFWSFDVAATWLGENTFGDEARDLGFLAGRELSRAPEFAANLGLNFNVPLNASLAVSGRFAYEWRDEHFTEAAIVAPIVQESYSLFNLTAGLDFLERGLRFEAFCRNCADEDYVTIHFNQPLGAGGINGYLGDPRTFGVQLRGQF